MSIALNENCSRVFEGLCRPRNYLLITRKNPTRPTNEDLLGKSDGRV